MAVFSRAVLSGMVACVALAAPASAQGQMTVTVPAVGCKTLATIDRILRIDATGDQTAFKEAVAAASRSGKCRSFQAGEVVWIAKFNLDYPVGICGRSAREIDCYWMSYEAFTASP